MLALLLPFLLALARSVPVVDDLVRLVFAERDKDRQRVAVQRQGDKDARVDAAIDRPAP